MGATHFLTKGLERVKSEMSLHVLAYNFRRLIAILGIANMVNAIRAHALFLRLQGLLWSFAAVIPMTTPRRRCLASQCV
jgi:transposase